MKKVLFVCTHNAGRSQMAEAFFNRFAPDDIRGESAGSQPAKEVWPNVVEAMREVGLDLTGRKPQKLSRELQLGADWAVTLACGEQCPYVPTKVEDWDIEDPAGKSLEEVRVIRDQVERHVLELVETRLEDIRADRTAHQMRLASLLPVLAQEFVGMRSDAEIRACADAVLETYDEVPVRSFVMTLAERRTRECLQADTCEALGG